MRRCRLDSADHRPLPRRTEREGVESEGVREFGTDSVYDDCFRGQGKGIRALSPTAVPIAGSPGYALWRGGLPLPPLHPVKEGCSRDSLPLVSSSTSCAPSFPLTGDCPLLPPPEPYPPRPRRSHHQPNLQEGTISLSPSIPAPTSHNACAHTHTTPALPHNAWADEDARGDHARR